MYWQFPRYLSSEIYYRIWIIIIDNTFDTFTATD